MSFECPDSCENGPGIKREKRWRIAQANQLFQNISGSKAMHWNFSSVNLLSAWTNLWCKMMEEKAGSRSRFQRKDSKRMSMPAAWGEFIVSGSTARPYSKHAGPTRTSQSSRKLQQFRNRQAEIPDTLLGLTGIANRGCPRCLSSWKQISQSRYRNLMIRWCCLNKGYHGKANRHRLAFQMLLRTKAKSGAVGGCHCLNELGCRGSHKIFAQVRSLV